MAADVHSERETTDASSGGSAPAGPAPELDEAGTGNAVTADGNTEDGSTEDRGAEAGPEAEAGTETEPDSGTDSESGTEAAERPAPAGRRRVVTLLIVAALALVIDIVSKMLVVSHLADRDPIRLPGGFLRLTMIRNSGAAFSIGEGQTWVFTIIATAVVVVILRLARNLRSVAWACALGLLLGGALGNLADRIFRSPGVFRGNVVDWLQFPRFPVVDYDFPVFNLADTAIVTGGCLMVLLSFLGRQPDGTRHGD